MKNLIRNKILLLVLIIVLTVIAIIGGSYAYWTWSSNSANIVFNTASNLKNYIIYDEGNSQFVGDFKVGDSYLDGIHTTISIAKTSEAENLELYATINMNVDNIGTNISNISALKWTLTDGDSINPGSVVSQGNFLGTTSGEELVLQSNIKVTTTAKKYTIWIWLDSSENIPEEIAGEKVETSVWTQIDQVIEERFEITKLSIFRNRIIATTVNATKKIIAYSVTNSNQEPTDWINIPSNEVNNVYMLDHTVNEPGTKYIWFKDQDNQVICKSIAVSLTFNITYKDVDSDTFSGTHQDNYPETYSTGTAVTLDTPTKEGYTFLGYYIEKDGSGSPVTTIGASEAGEKTFYAKWLINNFDLTYDCATNGGNDNQSASVTAGSNADLTKTCTKSGYTFVGWNTSSTATTKLDSYTMPSSDAILYGIYSKTITVNYVANGNTINRTSYSCTMYNTATRCNVITPKITAPAATPTIIGFSTSADSHRVNVPENAVIPVSYSTTYYAQTKSDEKTYSVTYGKDANVSAIGKDSDSCTIAETYNGVAQASSCAVTLPTITANSGYGVGGWYNGSTKAGDASASYNVSGNVTLTAKASAISYNISYSYNGGTKGTNAPASANYGSVVTINNPTKTVTATGNANGTGATIGGNTSKAQTFAGWTASNINTGTASYGTTSTDVSTIWSNGTTKTTAQYFKNLTQTAGATVTLTANWTPVALTLPTVSKTGYGCKWNTNSAGTGTNYNSGASYTPSATSGATVTMYAICTDTTAPTVTLNVTQNQKNIQATITASDNGSNIKLPYYYKSSTSSSCDASTTGFVSSNNLNYSFAGPSSDQKMYVCSKVLDNAGNAKYTVKSINYVSYLPGTVENYNYTGGEQVFTIPTTGEYKLEVWGAQGGSNGSSTGGYGGYSVGNTILSAGTKIYINVGGNPTTTTGGYNGGGNGNNVKGGGGATHIATSSGLLNTFSSKQNNILIVAGGGGGSGTAGNGGAGGGFTGVNGTDGSCSNKFGGGGTQTGGGTCVDTGYCNYGAFGQGASCQSCGNGGSGGGGYYGGGGGTCGGCYGGGGGGSGYLSSALSNKGMYCYNCATSTAAATKTTSTTNVSATATANYAKSGNGHARITYIAKVETGIKSIASYKCANTSSGSSPYVVNYTGNCNYTQDSNGYVMKFTTSGTFTTTTNLVINAFLVGGGSGGGNGTNGGTQYRGGAGGSGGGGVVSSYITLTAGQQYTITIGAGGAAGDNHPGGQTKIVQGSTTILYANGGNAIVGQDRVTGGTGGGGTASIAASYTGGTGGGGNWELGNQYGAKNGGAGFSVTFGLFTGKFAGGGGGGLFYDYGSGYSSMGTGTDGGASPVTVGNTPSNAAANTGAGGAGVSRNTGGGSTTASAGGSGIAMIKNFSQ